MSQLFFRCPHCRLPHDEGVTRCPMTGLAIEGRKARTIPPPPQLSSDDDSEGEILFEPSPSPSPPSPSPSSPPSASSPPQPLPRSEPPGRDSASALPVPTGRGRSLVGEVIGSYLVKGEIGRGATAIVYEGEHQVLGRRVALKVMTQERVQNAEARRRFLKEAQAAAALAHANICRIYDLGTLPDGAMYCAMEYLQGEPLSAYLEREGALPARDAVDIALQILSGLGEAHRKGIIHRDIKPENVFLARVPGGGRVVVKVLDFGLVKQIPTLEAELEGDDTQVTQITRTGVVVGTPFYMAPEAVRGQRDLDARVDLWAVGVLLYLMITAKLPFRGVGWADTAQGILQRDPPLVSSLRPSLPDSFGHVVARSLSKRREDRFATAAEFAAELTRVRRELGGPR